MTKSIEIVPVFTVLIKFKYTHLEGIFPTLTRGELFQLSGVSIYKIARV